MREEENLWSDSRRSEQARRPMTSDRSLALEVAEFVSCDPDVTPVVCDAILYEPDTHEEQLGTFAVILETIAEMSPPGEDDGRGEPPRTPRRFLEDLVESLRSEYYRDPTSDPLASFESALATANTILATAAAREAPEIALNFHAAALSFQQRTLHVSRAGAASVFLARHGHLTDIGDGLADPNVRNPKAAFTNIASGTVSEHDSLVLASPRLLRLIPRDRLAVFLAGKHPRDVVQYLRDLLAETNETSAVAALFLRFIRAPIVLPAPLRASRFPTPSQVPGALARPALVVAPPTRPRVSPRPPLQLSRSWPTRILAFLRRGSVQLAQVTRARVAPVLGRASSTGARAAQVAAHQTSRSARLLLARARGKLAREEGVPRPAMPRPVDLIANARAVPTRARAAVRSWPRSTKIFASLTLILTILFAGSLFSLRQKRIEEAAIRRASEQLQFASVKKDAAEAALIYDNLDEARRLLREARDSLGNVERTPYYEGAVANLHSAIQAAEDKAERIVRIVDPARAGDFQSVAPEGRVTGLALIDKNLFAFHPETNTIFRVSEGGDASVVSQTSQGVGYFRHAYALAPERMVLFATDSPGLALFDTERGDLVKQDLDPLPEGTKEIRSLATFGSRLYVLLPQHKQIYGYSKTLAGFSGGAPWLKEGSVPVDRAVSIGVDGYIYVLTEDGKIVKLLKGVPVDFTQSELATPLQQPTKLVITEALKFLYVLDPPQKRAVVYDTTGKLSRQFLFPNAQDLRDITVGGKDETLYALDGTTVYKVPLK